MANTLGELKSLIADLEALAAKSTAEAREILLRQAAAARDALRRTFGEDAGNAPPVRDDEPEKRA